MNNILYDGGFYNLGYLYRLQLLRSALKTEGIKEHAFIWDTNQILCKNILSSIGITEISYLDKFFKQEYLLLAKKIQKEIKNKIDIINYKLPYDIPGAFLYDYILKAQKSPSVDIYDENLSEYIFKFFSSIKFSENLINKCKPDIIALSHQHSYQCAPLAWIGAKKGIPVIICHGDFGVPRFYRISRPEDIYHGIGHPPKKNMLNLDPKKIIKLKSIGEEYLSKRISGFSRDIGGRYAFQKGKNKLILDQDKKDKKVISIYLANWFDWPHIYGMSRYMDILDWIKITIQKASNNKNVIWLLRPHPMESWFGGVSIKELFKNKLPPNVILLDPEYSGNSVIEISDALVTLHGTAAIEFASLGKPVLVADKGWYHDCGFVKFPKSKEEYFKFLEGDWYKSIKLKTIQSKSKLFAGLFFGIPYWQKDVVLPDDSDRKLLRNEIPNFVKKNRSVINREIKFIKKWLISKNIDYHTYKMENSNKFAISNINN